MQKESVEEQKQGLINLVKGEIGDYITKDFVENYDLWKSKLASVNHAIAYVDDTIAPYEYNEFCKKIIDITTNSLNNAIDYEKLFLTREEYIKISEINSGDKENFDRDLIKATQRKYMDHLSNVLSKEQLKESVRHKLGDKFYLIEQMLDMSMDIANNMMKIAMEDE